MSKVYNMTNRQIEVLRTIRKMQHNLRRAPTQRAVAEQMGTISRRTVCTHIANLASMGALDKYGKVTSIKFYDLKA